MSDEFGDFEDSDAFDIAPADPEQVAHKFHDYRRQLSELPKWEELSDEERAVAEWLIEHLLDWLHKEGSIP